VFNFVTPEEYFKLSQVHSLDELRTLAGDQRMCLVCGQPVWRLGGCGLCFTCTTGEADDSNDFELIEE
jgi:hypothetical protein